MTKENDEEVDQNKQIVESTLQRRIKYNIFLREISITTWFDSIHSILIGVIKKMPFKSSDWQSSTQKFSLLKTDNSIATQPSQ